MHATPPAHDAFKLSIAKSIALSQRHKDGIELLWFYSHIRLLYCFGVAGSIMKNRFRHLMDVPRFVSIPDPPGREDGPEFDRRVIAHVLVLRSHGEIPPEETMVTTMILLCRSGVLSFNLLEKLLGIYVAYLITETLELFDSTALSRVGSLVISFRANCTLRLIEDKSGFLALRSPTDSNARYHEAIFLHHREAKYFWRRQLRADLFAN